MKIAKSRSCAHFDVPATPGIASARSSSSGKVPSVFSEELKPSDKSRSKVAPRPKFSLSAAVAAALILEGGVAARSEKNAFSRQNFRSRDPDIILRKKWVGSSFHVIPMKFNARTGPVAVAGLEKMLNKVRWALGEVSL